MEKNQKKLLDKMIQALGMPDGSALEKVEECVKARFSETRNRCSKNKVVFVHGIGRRKTQEQRDYEDLKEAMERFGTYRNHLALMGIQKANDLHTLKPFLEKMLPAYGKSFENIVADAGYESAEN